MSEEYSLENKTETINICTECLQCRPDDERVRAGLKCALCAGYGEEASK